jgi:hypothetical protein
VKNQFDFLSHCRAKKVVPPTFKIKQNHQMKLSEKGQVKWQNNIKTLELNNLKIACDELHSTINSLSLKVDQSKISLFQYFTREEQVTLDSELESRRKKISVKEKNRLKSKLSRLEIKAQTVVPPCTRASEGDNIGTKKKRNRRFIKRQRYRRKMRKLSRMPPNNLCINYSSYQLSPAQQSLLNKHLSFVPIPNKLNKTQVEYDLSRFKRDCRWKEHFGHSDEVKNTGIIFPVKKHNLPNAPPSRTLTQFMYGVQSDILTVKNSRVPPNLTKEEKEGLDSLVTKQKEGEIVIQKSDKGGAVTIMDRDDYISSIELDHLQSTVSKSDGSVIPVYRPLDPVMVDVHYNIIKEFSLKAAVDGIISQGVAEMMVPPAPCAARAYGMPKAHKEIPEGKTLPPLRLVISGCGSTTENSSAFVDFYCKEIPSKLPSFIQDTPHILRILDELNSRGCQPDEAIPVTIDVVGLYPNIPQDEGKEAFQEFISDPTYRDQSMPWEFLMTLLGFVLKFNSFIFNGLVYLQEVGTAIGTKLAPTYANIFMGRLENQILSNWTGRPPDLWRRYIDDIFTIWSGTEQELLNFLQYMNSFHPSIKFTAEYRTKMHRVTTKNINKTFTVKREALDKLRPRSVDFLDTTIFIDSSGKFQTDLFVKSSDRITFLMPQSCHPGHICENIPFSLSYRLLRICSIPEIFKIRLSELSKNLLSRGYNMKVIKSAFNKLKGVTREQALKKVNKVQARNSVKLALTYDPRLSSPTTVIKKHYSIAIKDPSFKINFPYTPSVSYRRSRNLGDFLIRSKLYPTNQPYNLRVKNGFVKCDYNTHGCMMCRTNDNITTHTSLNSGKVHLIKSQIKCSDTYIIYVIQCKKCPLIEYVGQTTQPVTKRFYQHFNDVYGRKISKPIPEHFCQRDHSFTDMVMKPFEKLRKKDKTLLDLREKFWIIEKDSVNRGLNRII